MGAMAPGNPKERKAPVTYPVVLYRTFVEECWRYLTPRERALLPVLLLHLPNIAPGRDRLGKLAGFRHSAVSQGIAEAEAVGILTRTQRYTAAGDYGSNIYQVADLSDQSVIGGILARLRRRGAIGRNKAREPTQARAAAALRHGRGHIGVSAFADTGRAQLRTRVGRNCGHEVIIKEKYEQLKSLQGGKGKKRALLHDDERAGADLSGKEQAAAPAGGNGSPTTAGTLDAETDLKWRNLIPDDATPEALDKIIRGAGVHNGRAYKLSHNPNLTPAMVRSVLIRAAPLLPTVRNRGAYIGNLLDGELERTREAMAAGRADVLRAEEDALASADGQLDKLTSNEIRELCEADGSGYLGAWLLPGMAAELPRIRRNKLARKALARAWAKQQAAAAAAEGRGPTGAAGTVGAGR